MSEEVPVLETESGLSSSTVATVTVAATPWYKRFFSWFMKSSKKVFDVLMVGVRAGVVDFLNDEDNQALAVAAVKAAIDEGLRGEPAWASARDALVAQLKKSGQEASNTCIDTILQNAYCAVKYSVSE